MIKRFFTAMLGSLAAIWISLFLVVIGGLLVCGVIGAKAFMSSGGVSVEKHSILYLNLAGNIVDRYQPGSLFDELTETTIDKGSLAEMLSALRLAAKDKDIDGVYIDCNGSEMGVANRGELIQALAQFKKSGKWVLAYADNMMQGDYYVASVADSIYLNPQGMVDIHGLGAQMMFYKGLLDKLGVDIQILRVGKFKSAVEPYMLTHASEASQEQTLAYISGIWKAMVQDMATNRKGLTAQTINNMADSLVMTFPAEYIVQKGLVDALAYRHVFEDNLRRLTKVDMDDDLKLVTPLDYLTTKDSAPDAGKDHVALLYALGEIADAGEAGITSERLVPEILSLAQDDNVKGLVLRVNSPGGSAFASEQIWEALETFKATGKPFYVSMGDVAASGGYYISCGADKIYADPTTITGSIGIFGMIPNLNGLMTNHLGVTFTTEQTSPNGAFPSMFEPMTPQQHARMQAYIERGYETFVGRCAAGRKMSVDSIKAIAEGRVWYGKDALRLGLVDEMGTMEQVLKTMTAKLHLKDTDVVAYPEVQDDPMLMFLKLAQQSQALAAMQPADPQAKAKEYMQLINTLTSLSPVQARMEPVEIK